MQNSNDSPFILIYLNFKGFGQIIRYLLRYLDIPYTEIFLDEYQKQKKSLSGEVREALRGKAVNKKQLPAIIHNGEIIYELNVIMRYICIVFNREDLLGSTIFRKAQVCEFLEIFSHKIRPNVMYIFQFISLLQFGSYEGERLLEFLDQKFDYLLKNSGYFLQLATYLILQQDQRFVLGELTIVDFFFNEVCKFCLILFGNISEKLATPSWRSLAQAYQASKSAKGLTNRTCEVLNVMKKYEVFFGEQEFYKKHEAYFESFSYFPKMIDIQSHREALQKLKSIDFLEMLYRHKGE